MKILFASMPFDGHFLPLTGLAASLAARGHDVRFYAGPGYAERLARLGVPHLPFVRATDVNADNLAQHFPEYERLGRGPKAIEFALTKVFFANTGAHLEDILALREGFPFEALVADAGFYAAHLVASKLGVPTHVVAAAPSPAPTSPTAPPPFFGLRPARHVFDRLKHRVLSALVESSTRSGLRLYGELLAGAGLPPYRGSVFDLPVASATSYFQVGAPGLDFPRDDWPAAFRFVGAPPPPPRAEGASPESPHRAKRRAHASMVVVSQGTIDNRDPEKLLAPTLEALAGGPHLVVACTGGRHTEALRARFPQENVLVEDHVPFDRLMPDASVFVTNGGYGGVLAALGHGVPLVCAGKLEGKEDINARLDYRGLALDLRTERPKARQLSMAITRVLGDPGYAERARSAKEELASYDSLAIMEAAIVGGAAAGVAASALERRAS